MTLNKWEVFGPWLQSEREKTGVSQSIAAKATPIHVVQLSRIETGNSGLKVETLENLVAAINKHSTTGYKISADAALKKAGFYREAADENSGLFSGYENLSPDRQRLARRQIQAIIDSLTEPDEELADTTEHII